MRRAPASDRSSLASRLVWIAAAAWLAAVAGGFAILWKYKSTPAAEGALAPEQWPAASAVARGTSPPTPLLFAHPRCPRTRPRPAQPARVVGRFPRPGDASG